MWRWMESCRNYTNTYHLHPGLSFSRSPWFISRWQIFHGSFFCSQTSTILIRNRVKNLTKGKWLSYSALCTVSNRNHLSLSQSYKKKGKTYTAMNVNRVKQTHNIWLLAFIVAVIIFHTFLPFLSIFNNYCILNWNDRVNV